VLKLMDMLLHAAAILLHRLHTAHYSTLAVAHSSQLGF
jgi:hypothetical protein